MGRELREVSFWAGLEERAELTAAGGCLVLRAHLLEWIQASGQRQGWA